jgi:hypothetical protein
MGVGIYGLASCKVKCSIGWNQFQVGCSSRCPRIERIDEALELIMMRNWNEGESHGSLPIGCRKTRPSSKHWDSHDYMDKHVHGSKGEVVVRNAAGPCVA